ncbi:hypothetical protein C0J52_03873 [Blattella germanica]|nr:hypothetical protein C0J52_03873 [Blattella germanica]
MAGIALFYLSSFLSEPATANRVGWLHGCDAILPGSSAIRLGDGQHNVPFRDCTNLTIGNAGYNKGPWSSVENDDNSINTTFRIWYTQEFRFLLIPDSRVQAVEAVLMGGDCKITCASHRNTCEVTRNRTIIEDFQEPVYFTHLTIGYYYCVRQLQERTTSLTEILPPSTVTLSGVHYFIISVAVIVIVILTAFVVKKFYHRDDELLSGRSPVPTEDPEVPLDWISIQQGWQETETVLLLYSRDSSMFCEVIQSFRHLLEKFAKIKVLDPLEQMEMECVSENISGWLTQKIINPDIKLVLVVSEGAVIRQQILLQSKKLVINEPHFLDAIFTQALRHLHDSPDLGNDYSRVFQVRFEDFHPSNMELSHIVRFRLFTLLKHLGNLIVELKGLSPPYPNIEDIRKMCPEETNQLEDTIRNMLEFCAENPNHTSNRFYVVE